MKVPRSVLLLTAILAGSACGKFGDPLPPDVLAPQEVKNLVVTPTDGGMYFAWNTPGSDRRSKELKFLDGYSVERKEIVERGDETNPDIDFDQLAFIPDKSVEYREELREKAREEGKLGRRIESPAAMKEFTFLDPSAKRDRTYLYQIVPQNQGGFDGVVKQTVKVIYRGKDSDVSILEGEELEEKDDGRVKNQGKGK